MHLLVSLLLLLLLGSVEPRRGPRSKAVERGTRGHVRGRGRAGVMRRQTEVCLEYMESGEKYLDCQDRQLTTVMQDWPKDIHHLLLARNRIQVLRDNMFAQFTQLKSLDLQQNRISRVEDDAFSGLSQLKTLLLQHNQMTTASEEVLLPLPRLTYLRLYDNPWSCLCPLESLIRKLQLPGNRNLGNYAICAEPLSLKGQKLKKLTVDLLCEEDKGPEPGVVERPKPPPKIGKPDATSMCRTYMFPKPLLDCSNKDLISIPPDLPSDIVRMDLSNNKIKHLKPKHFVLSKDLKLLNLSSNNLHHIDTAAFAGLLYLRELDLSNNSLQYFQYSVLEDLYFLRKLSLDNNPWFCDYNIHYLNYWLKHHPGVHHTGLICSGPPEFKGWRVADYVKTYNGECPVDKQTEGTDTGQGAQEQSENDAQKPGMDNSDGQGANLPQHLKKAAPNKFKIIRLS
ncbi:leucine-rich repeat-containing protein 17 isoform X1 [Simochromis diagramma]|uniref:leucine-rich repeat-containing protein 17 isoform X1 n=1 Tax=Simochromis diagramma TaxID=43689 RepID=UPI001A7EA694|nr:leucine-rich repeat-containing protein 17 isoform X1 [Simochromis diagramma]XP_039891687.1 leucine-rich repeat-containing protein 17 isoform X1 [Simochromis diagramma]